MSGVAKSKVIKKVKCLSRSDVGRIGDKKTTVVDTGSILGFFSGLRVIDSCFCKHKNIMVRMYVPDDRL